MSKNKILTRAFKTNDIEMLIKLKNEGCDLSSVNIVKLVKNGINLKLLRFLIENGADVNAKNKNSLTALMMAIIDEEIDIVKLLIENNVDINAKKSDGKTAIMGAIEFGNIDIVKLLIKNSADISAKEENGFTAFMVAVIFEEIDIIKLLLENGADINAKNKEGETVLNLAIENENIDLIKLLIENGANINDKNGEGKSILYLALKTLNADIIELLAKSGVEGLNTPLGKVPNLLTAVISIGYPEVSQSILKGKPKIDKNILKKKIASLSDIEFLTTLIQCGSDVNAVTESGGPALMAAIATKREDIVKLLLENGAKVNFSIGKDSFSALMLAIDNNSAEIVKLLLSFGGDANGYFNAEINETYLIAASRFAQVEIVKLLLEYGANVNAKDDNQVSALMYAIDEHPEIIELLLEYGVDVNMPFQHGYTPLKAAAEVGNIELVKTLIGLKAEIDAKGKDGAAALACAIKNNHIDILKLLIDNGADVNSGIGDESLLSLAIEVASKKIIKLLVERNIKIDSRNKKKKTPLMYAVRKNRLGVVKYLLNNGADINTKDKKESTVLTEAAIAGNVEIVKYLIQQGVDIELDKGDSIILQVLIKSGYFMINEELLQKVGIDKNILDYRKDIRKIIQLLLNAGANPDIEDFNGDTALIPAAQFGDIKLVKLLIKSGADINHKNVDEYTALTMTYMPNDTVIYAITNSIHMEHKFAKKGLSTDMLSEIYKHNNALKIAKILIDHGAVLNKAEDWTINLMQGNIEWLMFILDHSDAENCNLYIHTLVILSSYSAEEILSKIQMGNNSQKELFSVMAKNIPFHMYLEILDLILAKSTDTNAQDEHGYTALTISIIHNNLRMTEALLKRGADVNIKSHSGYKAIDYAMGNKELRTLLLKNGATINRKISGKKFQKKIEREISKAIERELDPDDLQNDDEDWLPDGTFMSKALQRKSTQELKKALAKGAKLDFVNMYDLVADGYSAKFIEVTIRSGIDINRQDEKGRTALMIACESGRKKVVHTLVRYGADINISDNEGNDAWYYASLSGNEKIREILQNHERISAPNHRPQELVRILSNFTKETPIKYTTHKWENMGIIKEYGNYKEFMKAIRGKWEGFKEELKDLSPKLYHRVETFLFGTDDNTHGWSSIDGLEEWCDKGNEPFDYRLPESYIINGKEIATFGDVVNLFKQEIEIRKEYHMLDTIFADIEETLDDEYDIEAQKLDKTFYTDIESFRAALGHIFHEIKERKSYQIKIKAINPADKNYIDLTIIQVGSLAQNSSETMQQEVEDGGFRDIKKLLMNLCDWSIESSHDGDNYRVNYLRSGDDMLPVELLDYRPEGFIHRLRFYQS